MGRVSIMKSIHWNIQTRENFQNKDHGNGKRWSKGFKTGEICYVVLTTHSLDVMIVNRWNLLRGFDNTFFGCYDSVEERGDSQTLTPLRIIYSMREIWVAHSALPRCKACSPQIPLLSLLKSEFMMRVFPSFRFVPPKFLAESQCCCRCGEIEVVGAQSW